jgi:signal peptidase I
VNEGYRKVLLENLRSKEIPDPGPENLGNSRFRRFVVEILEISLISLFLFLSINAISARIRVESVSMQPTLFAGNFVVVNKLSYKIGSPNRGDIIVFRYPPNPELDPYIKRVIGLPGEEIMVEGGNVFINGVRIAEPYLETQTQQGGEWVVPQNALFVMGDNRNNSSDSRAWGIVPMENVTGKALMVYWPPEKWDLLSMSYAVAAEP